ncbi:MAG: ATP-binding protein [Ilumatobacteraceae bacterium]
MTNDTTGTAQLSFGTQELLQGVGVPMLITDNERVALWANQQFCDLFAIVGGPPALVGHTMTEIAMRVSTEFRDPRRFLDGIMAALDGGVAVSGDVVERSDGSIYRRSYYPVRIDGEVQAHVWRYDDVTDLHRRAAALERSAAVLQAMSRAHGPAVRGSTEREVFTTLLDALIELSGSAYGFIGEVEGDGDTPFLRTWAISDIAWDASSRDVFQTAMREQGYLEFHRLDTLYGVTLQTGEMVVANDPAGDPRAFGLPPGHPPLIAYLGLPIHHDGRFIGMAGLAGRPGGYDDDVVDLLRPLISACGTMIEATAIERERRAAEQALRAALDVAERANAAKTQLLGRVSHELRTPLNAVLGFAQLLARDEGDERRARWLAQIGQAGRHVLSQVEDLLDLAAAESGHLSVSIAVVELDAILSAVAELLAPLAAERSVQVTVEPTGLRVLADPGRLRVVLINLVSNAVKYNVAGGAVVISASHSGAGAVISVADDGPGIPAEEFERAFTMFERLDGAGRKVSGAGLGLAIARQYTSAMGGELSGHPGDDGGAVFEVVLPLAPPDEPAGDGVEGAAGEAGDGDRPWVLYVEDNPMNAELVVEYLHGVEGVRVDVAETLADARAVLAERTPSVMLLDLNLPDGFGGDWAAELEAQGSTLPVVLVTADAFAAGEVQARVPTLAGVVLKPLAFDVLSETVRRYVAAGD